MLDHISTNHAQVRMSQRGLRKLDVSLVIDAATRVSPDAYLMTNGDVEREITRRKHEIQQLERLRGLKVVVEGAAIVTAYRSRPTDQRRTLRKGREYQ